MPNDSKHIQADLSLIPTDWSRLRVAQVPRCRDLAIFMVTTDGQTDSRYPCACARDNNDDKITLPLAHASGVKKKVALRYLINSMINY